LTRWTAVFSSMTPSFTSSTAIRTAEVPVRWLRRTKKKKLPPGADERDRAKFAKARDYLVRVDDFVTCPNPRCRRRFEIPSDQTVALV
jgi:hypothetical protein